MVGMPAVLRRDRLEQRLLHSQRGLARGKPGPVRQAKNMRVYRDRRLAEGGVEDHIGGLAAHTRERLEFLARSWDLTTMPGYQDPAGLEDIGRFGVVEADSFDVTLEALRAEPHHRLRGAGDPEELRRCLVHTDVGCLSRQHHRDKQLKGRSVLKLGGRRGVGARKPFKECPPLGCIHREPVVGRSPGTSVHQLRPQPSRLFRPEARKCIFFARTRLTAARISILISAFVALRASSLCLDGIAAARGACRAARVS